MKISLFLIIYLIFTDCKSSSYKGYVYDGISKKPLSKVQITDLKSNHKSTTDENGYFELKKDKNISSILVFIKKPYYSDTISTIQIQNGERQKELFNGDTLYLLRKEARDSIYRMNNLNIHQ